MNITGTHINYFHVCHRELWLFANGIQMEHESGLVDEGRFIHETSYTQRAGKYTEIELDGIKIDFYDAKNRIVHEVKKSNKMEVAHRWQAKYYMLVLKENGIDDTKAILEYPKLRRTEEILLTDEDIRQLKIARSKIQNIIESNIIPPRIRKGLCRNCSYHDFCWSGEDV